MIYSILLILKSILFTYLTKVEHNRIFVIITGAFFILTIFSLLRKKDENNKLSFILYSIFSIIFFIDILHFTYFNVLPSISMISQVGQVADVKESLFDIFNIKTFFLKCFISQYCI